MRIDAVSRFCLIRDLGHLAKLVDFPGPFWSCCRTYAQLTRHELLTTNPKVLLPSRCKLGDVQDCSLTLSTQNIMGLEKKRKVSSGALTWLRRWRQSIFYFVRGYNIPILQKVHAAQYTMVPNCHPS